MWAVWISLEMALSSLMLTVMARVLRPPNQVLRGLLSQTLSRRNLYA